MLSLAAEYMISQELIMSPINRTLGLPVELSGSVSYVISQWLALL